MAPVRPRPRRPHGTSTSTSTSKSALKPSTTSIPPTSFSSTTSLSNPFKTPHRQNKAPTKTLKARSRHSALLARLHATTSSSKIQKRRRPKKKLVTQLEGLEDALPEIEAALDGFMGNGQVAKTGGGGTGIGTGTDGEVERRAKRLRKSLKSRPGAGKRREKVVQMERERFAKNLAVMAAGGSQVGAGVGPVPGDEQGGQDQDEGGAIIENDEQERARHERWAAIRQFVEGSVKEGG